ncbi:MAG: DUF924 family protein [Caulobacteraceae bacterium]
MTTKPREIIDFWRRAGPKAWFKKNAAFDAQVHERFEAAHHAAARGELDGWAAAAEGSLALLLLLDQFPRNLYRRSAHAFATDPLARSVARAAIAAGHDTATAPALRGFFYLPFEHSEDPADQALAVNLCEALERAGGQSAQWARDHHDIIARFGRFPHRNACLGRATTDDERAFLDEGGFAG